MKLMSPSVQARRWLPVVATAVTCWLSAGSAYSHSNGHSHGHKASHGKPQVRHYGYKHFNHRHHGRKHHGHGHGHHHPPPPPPPTPGEGSCGYAISAGATGTRGNSYQGWIDVKNVSGAVGTSFSLLLDTAGTRAGDSNQATFTSTSDGYVVSAPSGNKKVKMPVGSTYHVGFDGRGQYQGLSAQMLSVNGIKCDSTAPTISLGELPEFVTESGTLTLTATAADNVGVRRVVFSRDGVVLGEDKTAPYSFDMPATSELDGRHTITATAYDASGNQVSDSNSVLFAIASRFLGTAAAAPADYEGLLTYFNQLTPGNAGKWGSVEAERDVMNWAELDIAYNFAQDAGIPFKLHTLVWGQQQPAWLANLSAAEQLEELEEWMAALAARYPDVAFVDVVNEPMHAPPVYAEALGGAGATGWDWVINAFSMARTYFPNSELLLNEYQVLILEPFTVDYLEIVSLLQDEELIDGIAEQGHFLEQADVAEVASNLELFAATGLPIYISEFDVDYADDARQANKFRDLFSVFWDHPSVLGVTHWGHLQGSMWRTNAYLLRQDKSERPAMQWLMCYLGNGNNCSVPTYVPAPWSGDEYGVTLEAELYDDAEGVLALGSVVGYTDEGDWIEYSTVNFDSTWDKLKVTYAKGNEEVGTVSFHIDSLLNDPVAEVVLDPTAGWGSNDTLEVPWPSISGAHTLFVRFNETYGVANLDSIHIGKDVPPAPSGVELIANGDFESDTNGWYTWNGSVSQASDRAKSGTHSLLVSGGSGTGPAATSLMGLAQAGVTYTVSFWVSVGSAGPSQVNITQGLNCGGSTTYSWIANNGAVPNNAFVELTGSLAIPASCDLQGLQVYVEGGGANVPLYIDKVSIKGPPPVAAPNLVTNGDFESDTNGWFSWNGTVSNSTLKAQKGSRSLSVSGSGTGPAATMVSGIEAGKTYNVSFYVSVGNVASAQVNVTRALTCGGSTSYSWVANNGAVSADSWSQLAGAVAVPADCAAPSLMVYAEGGGANVDLFVDNVTVTQAP